MFFDARQPPASPRNDAEEARRSAVIAALGLLAPGPQPSLERIPRIAASVFGSQIAAISVIDGEQLHVLTGVNCPLTVLPRQLSFCTHTINCDEPLVVEDALADPAFRNHPLVCGERSLRFYAGRALRAPDGTRIGTLTVVDAAPRTVTADQIQVLEELAAQVEEEFARRELALAKQQLEEREQRLELALESSGQTLWHWNLRENSVAISGSLLGRFGYRDWPDSGGLELWLELVHPDDRAAFQAALTAFASGETETLEFEFRGRDSEGHYRWVSDRGRISRYDAAGVPLEAAGALTDIHERKLAEEQRRRDSEHMALAVRAGRIGTFEYDLEREVHRWDERMFELVGLPVAPGEVSAEATLHLFHPEDVQRVIEAVARVREGELDLEQEFRVVWPGGAVRYLRALGKVLELDGVRTLIGTCWDVTATRELQWQLSYQSSHDTLTSLPNRAEFERRLRESSRESRTGQEHSVCFIDIDRFKLVNDTAGHDAGDELLRQFARALKCRIRGDDVLARLGGDEFGLLLADCPPARAERVMLELADYLASCAFSVGSRVQDVTVSVGIAPLHAASDPLEAMSYADVACYAAKTEGRNRVCVFQPEHGEVQRFHRELRVAAGIREALAAERFCLYAQEIVPLSQAASRRPHYELLVRMRNLDGSLVAPDLFIPAAERYDLMSHIDRWVLREALGRQAARIAAIPELTLSLNLSGQSLSDPGLVPFVEDLLRDSPMPAYRVHFEITETATVTHLARANATMTSLRQAGCALALDDFGSGLSSFNYLKHFPVDFVKVDGSFVRNIVEEPIDRAIVESIADVARKLGACTIAEYVENEAVLEVVRSIGIDYAQGYGIGRPRPLAEVLAELEQRRG